MNLIFWNIANAMFIFLRKKGCLIFLSCKGGGILNVYFDFHYIISVISCK